MEGPPDLQADIRQLLVAGGGRAPAGSIGGKLGIKLADIRAAGFVVGAPGADGQRVVRLPPGDGQAARGPSERVRSPRGSPGLMPSQRRGGAQLSPTQRGLGAGRVVAVNTGAVRVNVANMKLVPRL